MGQLVVVNFLSLDGVIQSPLTADEDRSGGFSHGGWVTPYSDDTVAEFMRTATVNAAGMLLGRRSYEILSAAWSQADESEAAVAAMNQMPKYVVSQSLQARDLGWRNSRLVAGDLPAEIQTVMQETDGDVVVFGSGELVQALAQHDLVDEYRLMLFPVVIGAGKRMFGDHSRFTRYRLANVVTAASGVVLLTYLRTDGS